MYWIFKTDSKELPTQYFVGIKKHVDALIKNEGGISYVEEYPEEIKAADEKLFIAGSGRAGTTFLVQLLTRMNYFTGYVPYKETILKGTRAGCEYGVKDLSDLTKTTPEHINITFHHCPFVIKSPAMSWYLKYIALTALVPIAHVLIPIRDHIEVATSRVNEKLQIPLIGTEIHDQVLASDILLGKAIEACITARIPFSLARFPELIKDKEYCWSVLKTALIDCFPEEPDKDKFSQVFDELADPSMIRYEGVYCYRQS